VVQQAGQEPIAPNPMPRSTQQADIPSAAAGANPLQDGSLLPFPPAPMAGSARPRLQDSTPAWRPFPFNGTIHTVKVAMGNDSDTGVRRP
jgi:hypothetical protein